MINKDVQDDEKNLGLEPKLLEIFNKPALVISVFVFASIFNKFWLTDIGYIMVKKYWIIIILSCNHAFWIF